MANDIQLDDFDSPDIVLDYSANIETSVIDEFCTIVDAKNLNCIIHKRENDGPYAGIEWLLPPAIALFIAKPYIESFMGEMGKDHYHVFKKGIKHLWVKSQKLQITTISTSENKKSKNQLYSMGFSLFTSEINGSTFKFMFAKKLDEDDLDKTIKAALEFYYLLHCGKLDASTISVLSEVKPISGSTILITFDAASNEFIILDPLQDVRHSPKITFQLT